MARGRRFTRPLFLEPGEKVLPDILLLDAGEPIPMEVYGFWTGAYEERMEAKIRFYEETGRPHWAWRVLTQAEMPAFPEPIQARRPASFRLSA